jgi:hypothetical protein
MTEQEALQKMISPGQHRQGKMGRLGGVIQILVTSSCNLSCFNCTQASQIRRRPWFMTPDQFQHACFSLKDYFGVVGIFGGNPAISPHFEEYCRILREIIPYERRGLWCNAPLGKAKIMRQTFNPAVCNLNVHLDQKAFEEFKRDWPESNPFGQFRDSRHAPVFVAMKDVLMKKCPDCETVIADPTCGIPVGTCMKRIPGNTNIYQPCPSCNGTGYLYDEDKAWELISRCDINQHWSAGIGVFRGKLRAWFCEIAMAQSILHQDSSEYPDTGIDPTLHYCDWVKSESGRSESYRPHRWWQLPMSMFRDQVRKHCHECGVPLRGYGENAQSARADSREQVSKTHATDYKPKPFARNVETVTQLVQLGMGKIHRVTDYIYNSQK